MKKKMEEFKEIAEILNGLDTIPEDLWIRIYKQYSALLNLRGEKDLISAEKAYNNTPENLRISKIKEIFNYSRYLYLDTLSEFKSSI